MVLAVTFSPDVLATVYPSEREEVTIPAGYSGAEVLQALFNAQVPECHKMDSKEAARAFKEHCSYAGFFDYVDGVAIKTHIIEKSGAALIFDVTVYNYREHGKGAGQKALQPLVDNPPPSVYPDAIERAIEMGVLD